MTCLHNHDQILEFLRKIFLKGFQIYQNYLCALKQVCLVAALAEHFLEEVCIRDESQLMCNVTCLLRFQKVTPKLCQVLGDISIISKLCDMEKNIKYSIMIS